MRELETRMDDGLEEVLNGLLSMLPCFERVVLLIDDLIFSKSIPEDAGEVLQSIRWWLGAARSESRPNRDPRDPRDPRHRFCPPPGQFVPKARKGSAGFSGPGTVASAKKSLQRLIL